MLRKKRLRDIKQNLSQFITIFLMLFIGIMAYSGIESYMDGMQESADNYYSKNNLQDLNVMGENFTTDDLDKIKSIEHVKDAERKLSLTATDEDNKDITYLLNFIESNNISKFYVYDGEKFDANKSGVWVDSFYAKEKELKIGDVIKIKYDDFVLKEKIIGLVNIPDHVYDVKDSSELYPSHDTFGIAITIFLVVFIKSIKYKKSLKNYDNETLEILDEEMNSEEAFYYTKLKLYLTKDYIVNINGTFKAIKYSDILWMYFFEQRVNGMKTNQAIKVFTNDGKTSIVALINITTKNKKEMYNEIWNTILDKNNKITTGYTKENIKYFNKIKKEIKKNKKESF